MNPDVKTPTKLTDEQLRAEREAAIQPKPKIDAITNAARKKSADIPADELQREILAQLYIQNHYLTHQFKTLQNIKGHLGFYTVMLILSFMIGIAVAAQ